MYHTKNSNPLVIACPLIFLAALYVPTPVQSQHPYRLVSAIVDKEDPNDGQDVFTLDTYRMIEFAYVDDGISQVRGEREDGTEKVARFRSLDYHTMILDVVIFDTGSHSGSPNRMVKCQFRDKDDAKEFFHFIRPCGRRYQMVKFGVISVLQYYHCIGTDCENERCDDPSCDGKYHNVSGIGQICIETITKATYIRPALRRFVIRGEDGDANMVFTTKTFNIQPLGNNACIMSLKIKHLSFTLLIEFGDEITGQDFYFVVDTYQDLDRDIPLGIPHV